MLAKAAMQHVLCRHGPHVHSDCRETSPWGEVSTLRVGNATAHSLTFTTKGTESQRGQVVGPWHAHIVASDLKQSLEIHSPSQYCIHSRSKPGRRTERSGNDSTMSILSSEVAWAQWMLVCLTADPMRGHRLAFGCRNYHNFEI